MAPTETAVTMSVYADHTVAECFFQNGRTALSVVTTVESGRLMQGNDAAVSVTASGGGDVKVKGATVWAVDPIWVEADDL